VLQFGTRFRSFGLSPDLRPGLMDAAAEGAGI
jgi:hypothetical protein